MLHIGVLQFTLEIPHATSLKEKRSVIKGLRERLRRAHNISIAETDDQEEWTVATLGITAAGSDIPQLNSLLDRILNTLQDWRDASLMDHRIEIFSPQ
ncbi:MAG: DUF503 domain-containing protein [Planctomycetes bacterium]|nr:DUF503 domain-containing protein [Planctomycetota bacterium]MCB9870953.1 DUF503 domain-containing protein [Planctomycetota bacterium]MCB9888317.1 DUF503 domain-containing protein [Planctomycetota bacterium]